MKQLRQKPKRLYWVVRRGDWNDPMSWSYKPDGLGGDGPPNKKTDLWFVVPEGKTAKPYCGCLVPKPGRDVAFTGGGTVEMGDGLSSSLLGVGNMYAGDIEWILQQQMTLG